MRIRKMELYIIELVSSLALFIGIGLAIVSKIKENKIRKAIEDQNQILREIMRNIK